MHRTIITTILLTAGLALTGCGSATTPAAKPSASPTIDKRSQFLTVAHGITFNGSPTDDELAAFPPQWCAALDAGHSVAWLFDLEQGDLYPVGDEWGTVKQDADTLLVAGVKAYCPANSAALTAELRASGEY